MRRPIRWTASLLTMVFAPALAFAAVLTAGKLQADDIKNSLRNVPIFTAVANWFQPRTVMMGAPAVVGKMLVAPPTPTPKSVDDRSLLGRIVVLDKTKPHSAPNVEKSDI
jgi:hypothetical protein